MTAGLVLGRPGVYPAPPRDERPLETVRLDIAGFVGVSRRGPVDVPVLVTSWSDYVRRFGGYIPGDNAPDHLLPYAVQTFFAQGGTRAYALRVAPPPDFSGPTQMDATATFGFDGAGREPWRLAAADEGEWGAALDVRLEFEAAAALNALVLDAWHLLLPFGVVVADRSTVRLRPTDRADPGEFRVIQRADEPVWDGRAVELDRPLSDSARFDGVGEVAVEVVTATVVVVEHGSEAERLPGDRELSVRRDERLSGFGLVPGHVQFLGRDLGNRSLLVRAIGAWSEPGWGDALVPDRYLRPWPAALRTAGLDRNFGISFASFFDALEPGVDPIDEGGEHRGVDAMTRVDEVALLCVPDLMWRAERGSPPPPASPPVASSRSQWPDECDPCRPPATVEDVPARPPAPRGLDATAPDDYAEIVRRQRRMVAAAVATGRCVALLDVPAGLALRRIGDWRAQFDTAYAAAYHPWLGVPGRGAPDRRLVFVPPAAFAAGITAVRERRFGLPWAPSNELAADAVVAGEQITDDAHDRLHAMAINVFRAERDGFRLSSARTLSSDPSLRQLSVRRLMTMIRLSIERQTQWLVFEPNTEELRRRLQHTVVQFLRRLQRRGAFAGATEAESFYVRCDDSVNSAESLRQGRLIAEVGVAPSSPLEYLVLRISQDVDGELTVEGGGGREQ